LDTQRFLVFIAVSLAAFAAILAWVLRDRPVRPKLATIVWVSAIVVVAGMFFARYAARAGISPVIYYGVPALVTLLLPPVIFSMRRRETAEYLILAFASSPLIHIVFSLLFGWHEYLPFWYLPSLADFLQGAPPELHR
jgi:hypothetical protein